MRVGGQSQPAQERDGGPLATVDEGKPDAVAAAAAEVAMGGSHRLCLAPDARHRPSMPRPCHVRARARGDGRWLMHRGAPEGRRNA